MFESTLAKLFTHTFSVQLSDWFSKIVARWLWLMVLGVIIVQPWIGWGYWDKVHTPNFFFYLAFLCSIAEISLQILAVTTLRDMRRKGWVLLYYSNFLTILYGVIRIFSSDGNVGPLVGLTLLATIFFYVLFQTRPSFRD